MLNHIRFGMHGVAWALLFGCPFFSFLFFLPFFFLTWLCAVKYSYTFYIKKAIFNHEGSNSLLPLSSTS